MTVFGDWHVEDLFRRDLYHLVFQMASFYKTRLFAFGLTFKHKAGAKDVKSIPLVTEIQDCSDFRGT